MRLPAGGLAPAEGLTVGFPPPALAAVAAEALVFPDRGDVVAAVAPSSARLRSPALKADEISVLVKKWAGRLGRRPGPLAPQGPFEMCGQRPFAPETFGEALDAVFG